MNTYKVLCVQVNDECGQTVVGGWDLEKMQIFILAEGWHYQVEGTVRRKKSCVDFDLAHLAIHMIRIFVIKGCVFGFLL